MNEEIVSRGSSVSIVSDYGLDDRAIEVRSPAGARIFPLTSVSRPALGPTQIILKLYWGKWEIKIIMEKLGNYGVDYVQAAPGKTQ
jgi:hypothetical protein